VTDAEAAAVGAEGERCDETFNSESGRRESGNDEDFCGEYGGESGNAASGGRLDKFLSSAPFEARCEALRETRFDARSEALKALRRVACGAAAKAVSLSPDRGGFFGLARAGGRSPRR
jgi:hypothetical protein